MASTSEEATPSLYSEIDVKEEPILTDSCHQQPMEELEQIYIKEENIKLEIADDLDAHDPLQLEEEKRGHESSIDKGSTYDVVDNGSTYDVVGTDSIMGNVGADGVAGNVGTDVDAGNVGAGNVGADGVRGNVGADGVAGKIPKKRGRPRNIWPCGNGRDNNVDGVALKRRKELRNEVQQTNGSSESESIISVTMEEHSTSGGSGRLGASDASDMEMGNAIRNTVQEGEICDRSSSSLYLKHGYSDCNLISCSACVKKFETKSILQKHSRLHMAQRDHRCEMCHKVVPFHCLLGVHSAVDTEEQSSICSVCVKRIELRRLLEAHLPEHTGETACACLICQKKFRQSSSLRIHLRSHTGKRPHTCGVCGKTFINSSSLNTHSLVHAAELPYACSFCHKTFKKHTNQRTHRQITHTGEGAIFLYNLPQDIVT